jgi:membrane-associated phospholipid phosphatase
MKVCRSRRRLLIMVLALCPGLARAAQDQSGVTNSSCGQIVGQLPHDLSTFGRGLAEAPRNAIRPNNLKWELPIAAVAATLIASGADTHVNSHIHSGSFAQDATRGSNVGLGIELGAAGLIYAIGCPGHRSSYAAKTGWTALEAMGVANLLNIGIKAATNRQYAYQANSTGEFWEGGKSFPSGHAAMSFAFASVVAHRYPRKPWLKWSAYGLATGVSLARVAGKKHFPSDVLVGATLGYVTGTYLSGH